MLGYVFNPLSVYYCHDRDERLACVVAEVHNTYGERHCYLLRPDAARPVRDRQAVLRVAVSDRRRPLSHELCTPRERLNVTMDLVQDDRCVFRAALTGRQQRLTERNVRRMLVSQPLMTAKVTALIHLHGVALRARGLRRIPRPVHEVQEGVG